MSKPILPTTLNAVVDKIRNELRAVDKIVDYNPTNKSELLMVYHKGKLFKQYEYESDRGSYKGFEWYIPETKENKWKIITM